MCGKPFKRFEVGLTGIRAPVLGFPFCIPLSLAGGWAGELLKNTKLLKIFKNKIIDELPLLYTYLSVDWAPQLLYSKKNYNYLQQNIQKIACNAKIHEFLSNWQLSFVAKTSAGGPAGDAERKSNYGRPYNTEDNTRIGV